MSNMPWSESTYRAPPGFSNGHVQTIFPALFRHVRPVTKRRETLTTPDGDLLGLAWNTEARSKRLAVLSHGLEGSALDTYVQGMARAFLRRGWDVLAWNFRGCGGTPNRRLRSYHSGSSDDLALVVNHAARTHPIIALIGFSLGGNVTLKYLGEPHVHPAVSGAAAFSVPCDLASSALRLEHPANRLYMARFLVALRAKIRAKMIQFPGALRDEGLAAMRTFRQFDGAYTAPIHGFADAEDYWRRASSRTFLPAIRVPTLLVNALDDPFLPPPCFPRAEAEANAALVLETPARGGHLGFVTFHRAGEYWSETRAATFLAGL